MPQPHTTPFYRLIFLYIDPLVILIFVSIYTFFQPTALLMLHPDAPLTPSILESALLHQVALLFGFMGIICAVLLRASSDTRIWRIVLAGVLAAEVCWIAAGLVCLERQGRLNVRLWRGVEWFNLLGIGGFAVVRGAYLMGVGLGVGMDGKVGKGV
jgi:hypothetical protein